MLIVNLNPGGPNKGSATQYFLGDFDGNKFTPYSTGTKWLDYGPDEYAGITWGNTGSRKIFLGWMSNWLYANVVPTVKWRNAMTIPRELQLKQIGKELYVTSKPVVELKVIQSKTILVSNLNLNAGSNFDLSGKTGKIKFPFVLKINIEKAKTFSLVLSNDPQEQLVIGYDNKMNQYFIDRTASGKVDFQNEFAAKHTAPRFTNSSNMNITLVVDESSVELFADDGLTVMTETFFVDKPYKQMHIETNDGIVIKKLEYSELKSIWP